MSLSKDTIIGILAIALIAVLVFALIPKFKNISSSQTAAISGSIDLNGQAPQGATISIAQKEMGAASFNTVVSGLAAEDGVTWIWNGAQSNKNYQLQAYLVSNGQTIATSQTLTLTAPAADEVLSINYTPANSNPQPSSSPQPTTGRITGTIDLNGYIPQGSYITLSQKGPAATSFTQFGSSFSASNGETWVWREAVSGTQYQIQANLFTSSGQNIGTSNPVVVTSPAANTTLVLNSTAQAPSPTTGTISGSINLNGAVPSNSSIVILATPAGANNYTVVANNIQPANGSQWSWNGAQVGTSYQVMAVLKQTNSNNTQSDVADSQSLVVSAPASGEVLTLNTNISLPPPNNGAITLNCASKNQAQNTWNVQFNFPSISGAQTYWYQIGTTSGGSNTINTTQPATNNPSQTVNATINDSVLYYAQYAYSYSPNASWNNGFSNFSGSYTLKCPN